MRLFTNTLACRLRLSSHDHLTLCPVTNWQRVLACAHKIPKWGFYSYFRPDRHQLWEIIKVTSQNNNESRYLKPMYLKFPRFAPGDIATCTCDTVVKYGALLICFRVVIIYI